MSAIDTIDRGVNQNVSDNELKKKFSYGGNFVRENLKEFEFIQYYKGWIPERFSEVNKIDFSFVHIDVDLYQPIKDSIEFFYPRMIAGGIMVFDDYGYTAQFPGAKKAVDELLNQINYQFLYGIAIRASFLNKMISG